MPLLDGPALAAALDPPRPAQTLRAWASAGLITRHGKDARGRTLYDLDEVIAVSAARRNLARMTTPVERYKQARERLEAADAEWAKYLPTEAEPVIDRAQPGFDAAYEALVAAEAEYSEALSVFRPELSTGPQ